MLGPWEPPKGLGFHLKRLTYFSRVAQSLIYQFSYVLMFCPCVTLFVYPTIPTLTKHHGQS